MKKYTIIIATLIGMVSALYSQVLDAHYRVSFGAIGEIGKAKAHLERDAEHYRIEVAGEATGFAKHLSRNRKEIQVSEGHIRDGLLVSDRYSVIRSYGNKVIKKVYTIDHEHQRVVQSNETAENGVVISQELKTLDFYTQNDLLTLYFNMTTLIPDKEKKALYTFKSIGAEKQQGSVEVIVPSKEERVSYEKYLGEGGAWYLTAIIHQKIFSSSRGELILKVNEDGITQKAMLKDVIMFGDIVAGQIEQ